MEKTRLEFFNKREQGVTFSKKKIMLWVEAGESKQVKSKLELS